MDGLRRLQLAQQIVRKLMSLISQISKYEAEKEKLRRKLTFEENTKLIDELNQLIEKLERERTSFEKDLAEQLEKFNEWASEVNLRIEHFNIIRIRHREYILGELLADLDIAVLLTTKFLREGD